MQLPTLKKLPWQIVGKLTKIEILLLLSVDFALYSSNTFHMIGMREYINRMLGLELLLFYLYSSLLSHLKNYIPIYNHYIVFI